MRGVNARIYRRISGSSGTFLGKLYGDYVLKRLILIAAVAICAVIMGTAVAVYWFLGGDQLRVALEQQGTERLGQQVAIGSATARLLPRPSIALRNVRIGDRASVTLDDIELSTGLKPLLSR